MMNLTDRLEDLAEADAPPMDLDIARAREAGRRRRRRRRAAVVGGIAAVAVVGTFVAPTMVKSVRRPDVATPAPAPAALTSYATFGWLPDGITRTDFGVGAHGDYTHAVDENHGLGTHLWLHVHPAGAVPKLPLFHDRKYALIPAQPVNGRTAYWASAKPSDPLNGGDAVLIWLASDGQWVELHAYYLNFFADPKTVLHRVATNVEVAERAEPLPVAITGMPARYRINEVSFDRPMAKFEGTGAWDLRIFYEVNDRPVFTILVNPEGTRKKSERTVGLTCKAAKGVEVCVSGGEFTDKEAVDALGGPHGVLAHFTPLGMNESDWRAR